MQLKNVKAAINTVINNSFKSEVIAYRIEKNIPRPSFKVFFGDIRSSAGMNNIVEKNVITRIYYYPSDPDDCETELLEIRDKLSDLFSSYTKIGEEVLRFNEYEDDAMVDMIQASFEINFSSTSSEETVYPNMDNLEFELREGE